MDEIFSGPGFLGTFAPFFADASLVLILLSILLLVVGWQLRIRRRDRSHCIVQTAAVILNIVVVAAVMIGSFLNTVLPALPAGLLQAGIAVTTLHALLGTASAGLGLFIVLRVNNWVPRKLRFNDYKLFMRAALVLYALTAVLGIIVYLIFYVGIF